MNHGYLAVAVAVAVVALAAGATFDLNYSGDQNLVVETVDGEVLTAYPVNSSSTVSLEYIHSVEKTRVKDVYVVEDGSLVMDRTEFRSFGAGLPTEDVETRDDGVFVHRPERPRRDELYVAPGEVSDHELVVDGSRYRLAEHADTSVRIRITTG